MEPMKYPSPDGMLVLIVQQDGDDLSVGFEGSDWHTHGDLLVPEYGDSPAMAVEGFVESVKSDKEIIVVSSTSGAQPRFWVTDDPDKEVKYKGPDESLSFRYWSGAKP